MLPLEQNFHYLQIVQLSSVRAFHLHSRLRIDVCELWILINVGTCVQIEQLQFPGKSLNNNNKKKVSLCLTNAFQYALKQEEEEAPMMVAQIS